jgi:hypothetical protein
MVMNSPQNENGKTNLPLGLCQETEGHLTVDRECYSRGIEPLSAANLTTIPGPLTVGCFIRPRPLIEAKVMC